MNEQERFNIINSIQIDKEILEYLKKCFMNLEIEILSKYNGNIIYLMKFGKLEGWCWQTTNTAILFLNNNDYNLRGNLKFSKYKNYYHSWIIFNYNNFEYVFDPCLNILCKKEDYDNVFEPDIKGKVLAVDVKIYFINYITNLPKKEIDNKFNGLLKKFIGEDELEKQDKYISIYGNDDVYSPMYRNNVGYKVDLENNQIKKLVARYYLDV